MLISVSADDQVLSPEEEASINVDALVNDSIFDQVESHTSLGSQVLDQPRRATPTIPPGFSAPAVPKPIRSEQPARPSSRNTLGSIAPAIPVIPVTPGRAATPGRSKKVKSSADVVESSNSVTEQAELSAAATSKPQTPTKQNRKTSSAKTQTLTGAQKTGEEEAAAAITEQKENKQNLTTPVKSTPKAKAPGKRGKNKSETSPEKDIKAVSTPPTTLFSSKRQHPGKLDIAAATILSESERSGTTSVKVDTQPKNVRAASLTATDSVPASPSAVSTSSPIKKPAGTRTLRVVATPKTENPPPLSAVSSASLPHVSTVEKLRSRQASIASINQPGTPASELVSDTASITSTSISRANSPPPGGKVGTAPMRKKTKNQQKKERQEMARRREEEDRAAAIEEHTPEPEIIQAPIMGRKKKTKKSANNPKLPSLPKKQPESPKASEVDEEKSQEEPISASAVPKEASTKATISSPTPEPAVASEQVKDKREPTTQSIIADLQKTGELIASTLEFFKPLSSSLAHASHAAQTNGGSIAPPDLKIHFSEADLDNLAKKRPVRLHDHEGKSDSRTLITPQGKFFWGLTQELEEKALELEKHIEELKGVARFHPPKQTSHQKHSHHIGSHAQSQDMLPALATALKEAGAKLSKSTGQPMPKLDPTSTLLGSSSLPLPPVQPPTDLAPPQQAQQQQTPSDAGAYLNQFVLPKTDNPPPNTPRPEMAAVGGPPGSGTANMSLNVNKIAKAARAVAEGGTVGTELDGMGVMASDLLGGVFVQGLEALVGAGLGFSSTQDLSLDSHGNISLGENRALDVQGLVSAFEAGGGLGAFGSRGGRRSVLSVDEAEQAMLAAKKEHDAMEKKLTIAMKRNKKMLSSGRA